MQMASTCIINACLRHPRVPEKHAHSIGFHRKFGANLAEKKTSASHDHELCSINGAQRRWREADFLRRWERVWLESHANFARAVMKPRLYLLSGRAVR
jgi:hypothetical protein